LKREHSIALPPSLRVFLLVNLGLTVLCLVVELICALRGLPFRYCFPFYVGLKFYDYDCFRENFQHFHQAAFFDGSWKNVFSYPAPAAVVYSVFYKAWCGGLKVYLGFLLAGLGLVTTLYAQSLHRRGVSARSGIKCALGVALLAFPYWFAYERANLEFLVILAVLAGLYGLVSGHGYWAAGSFGLAASLKLLPLVYLGLFLYRRQYRQLLFGLAVLAAVTLLSLRFMGPTVGVAWRGIAHGVEEFRRVYMVQNGPGAAPWDHSLFGLVRLFMATSDRSVTIYSVVTAVTGVVLFFARIVRLPLINQVLCLSVAAVWLAPVSFEYTLMGLYGVFGMLSVACLRFDEVGSRRVMPLFVMLGILFSPLSEVIWRGVQYGGQVKCLVLGGLFLFGSVRPVFSEYDKNNRNSALAPGGRHFVL
jgi:Glycosyltransferase family 87